MIVDQQTILQQLRKIYLRETGFSYDNEIDNDTDLGKMNGIKVDGDDLSLFIRAVQTDFDIPILQSDCNGLFTLRDYCNFVLKKLNGKKSITPEEGI